MTGDEVDHIRIERIEDEVIKPPNFHMSVEVPENKSFAPGAKNILLPVMMSGAPCEEDGTSLGPAVVPDDDIRALPTSSRRRADRSSWEREGASLRGRRTT
jgi:hypothetical protein